MSRELRVRAQASLRAGQVEQLVEDRGDLGPPPADGGLVGDSSPAQPIRSSAA